MTGPQSPDRSEDECAPTLGREAESEPSGAAEEEQAGVTPSPCSAPDEMD